MKLRTILLIAMLLVFPLLGVNAAVIMDCGFDTPTFGNPANPPNFNETVSGHGSALEGLWWTDSSDSGYAITSLNRDRTGSASLGLNVESSNTSADCFIRATIQQELDTGNVKAQAWIMGKDKGFRFGGMATEETIWTDSKVLFGVFRWFFNNQWGYFDDGVITLIPEAQGTSTDVQWGKYTFNINFDAGTYDLDIVEGGTSISVTNIALNSNALYDSLKYLAIYEDFSTGLPQGDDAQFDDILVETLIIPQPTATITGAIALQMSDLLPGALYDLYWSDTDLPDTSPSWNFAETVTATGTAMTWTDRGDLGAAPPRPVPGMSTVRYYNIVPQ